MPKLRMALLCVLMLMFAALSGGCWDSHEINTLSLVSGIAIDPAEEPGRFDVTVQIRKNADRDKEPKTPFLLLEATGQNVLEALDDIRRVNNRELYLHQNEIIIISKDQAMLGIRPLLDVFLRYHETRMDVWVIISECPAKDVLKVELVQEPISATALARMMDVEAELSPRLAVNMLNVTEAVMEASRALVVPSVNIIDELGISKLIIEGTAVLVSDKLVGYLTDKETQGYALGAGPVHSGLLEVTTENGTAVLYISDSKVSMKTHWAGDHAEADISFEATLSVAEITGFKGEQLPDVFQKLEGAAVNRVVELITMAFRKSVSLGADIFGIGGDLERTQPGLWKQIKSDWQQLYPKTVLNVSAKGILLESGKISSALTMQAEE